MISFFGKIFTSITIGISSLFGVHAIVPEVVPPTSTNTQAVTTARESSTETANPDTVAPTTKVVPKSVVPASIPISSSAKETSAQATTSAAPVPNTTHAQKPEPVSIQKTQVAPIPKVKVTAKPATVEYGGNSAIGWVATDALSCTLGSSPILLAVTGSQSVSPTDSSKDWKKSDEKTYSITCTGVGGSVSENVTVTVQPWKPSVECQKAFDGYYYRNEITLNPTFCSKMEM